MDASIAGTAVSAVSHLPVSPARRGVCLATFPNGSTLRAWRECAGGADTGSLWAQAVDARGEPYAEAFEVSADAVDASGRLVGAALDQRRCAIAWVEAEGARGAPGVCLRVFDLFGDALGPEVRLDGPTTLHPIALAIAAPAASGFVLAWVGHDERDDACVCVQCFDDVGLRVGAVHRAGSGLLEDPPEIMLTALPSGGFVLTWRDRLDQAGSLGAAQFRTQMFDRSGECMGDAFACNFRS